MRDPTPEVYTNDGDRLLAAIRRADPQDDMPRLGYADWLEERGDLSDREKATVQFIRNSCRMEAAGRTKTMPKDVYPWVRMNWTRLIPTFLGKVKPIDYQKRPGSREHSMPKHRGWWAGRWAVLRPRVLNVGSDFLFPLQIEFWKGFVNLVEGWRSWDMPDGEYIRGLILADQPLARFVDVDKMTRKNVHNPFTM